MPLVSALQRQNQTEFSKFQASRKRTGLHSETLSFRSKKIDEMTEGKPWGLEARAVPSSAATQVTTRAHGGEKLCLDSQIHINPVTAAHVCKPRPPVVM